jgi:hypothetical protein
MPRERSSAVTPTRWVVIRWGAISLKNSEISGGADGMWGWNFSSVLGAAAKEP